MMDMFENNLVPEVQSDRIEDDIYDYPNEETFYNKSIREIHDKSLIFGRSHCNVSFSRGGTKHRYEDVIKARSFSTSVLERNKENSFIDILDRDIQSLDAPNLFDSMFFDSEDGKDLIVNDQEFHEQSLLQENYCAGYSLHSSDDPKIAPGISKDICASVNEFLEIMNFPDNQAKPKTPFVINILSASPGRKKRSMSEASLMDVNELPNTPSLNVLHKPRAVLCMETPEPIVFQKFSTPKWAENNEPGFSHNKNIQRLRSEEIQQVKDDAYSIQSPKARLPQLNNDAVSTGSGSELRGNISALTDGSDFGNDEWFIEPKSVVLNPNKGNRVQLSNMSTKPLRFKTIFDIKMINICPLSGTVPAKCQIGLRLIISPYARLKNENFNGAIKLIIGKKEQDIHVQFRRKEKLAVFK